jgi:hypothetical protein
VPARRLHPLVYARRPATAQKRLEQVVRESKIQTRQKVPTAGRTLLFMRMIFAGPPAKVVPCLFCSQPAVTCSRFRCLWFGNGDPALAEPVSVPVCSVPYHIIFCSGI